MSRTYAEKLLDPRWQKMRLEILDRDNFTCQACGDKQSTLHVHHTFYHKGKEPWEAPENCLVTLCDACHAHEHDERECYEHDIILIMRQSGFLIKDLRNVFSVLQGGGKEYFKNLNE